MIEHDHNEVRRSLSRSELDKLLTEWMVQEFGNPKDLPAEQQNAWHERNGFANHFFRHLFKHPLRD